MAARPLLLIPTPQEADLLLQRDVATPAVMELDGHSVTVALAGFGPVAAAALSSRWLAECRPSQVILLGVAGSYDTDAAPLGSAWKASSVLYYGLGVGEADQHSTLPYPAVPAAVTGQDLGSELQLAPEAEQPVSFLTCASASLNSADTDRRRRAFPQAMAEDMESYSVALAARLASVPCTIIRGISNRCGDRDVGRWQVQPALQACRSILQACLDVQP